MQRRRLAGAFQRSACGTAKLPSTVRQSGFDELRQSGELFCAGLTGLRLDIAIQANNNFADGRCQKSVVTDNHAVRGAPSVR
jgi:hypothetical protein